MEEWPRLATSFSSLPTTSTPSTSSSPSSSSASLHPLLLLDLADELWFSRSVVPFPSFSLPCLPPLFSSLFPRSPDPSTLLAQLMFSTAHSHLPPSYISSSPPSPSLPPLQQPETPLLQYSTWDLPAYTTYPPPSDGGDAGDGDDEDADADAYHGYPVRNYRDACSYGEIQDPYPAQSPYTGNDENAYAMPGYGNNQDPYPTLQDEDAYPAAGYGENEDAYHGYLTPANDGENAEHADIIEEQKHEVRDCKLDQAHPADPLTAASNLDAEDALSGIYDVGVLLKNQYCKEREDVQHNKGRQEALDVVLLEAWPRRAEHCEDGEERKNAEANVGNAKTSMGNRELDTTGMSPHVSRSAGSLILSHVPIHRRILPIMSTLPSVQVVSCNEQVDMKEHLKLWAYTVASTLHRKEGMRAKQVW